MIEDSLRLEELPDGKYKLVWDPEDPNYFFLNDMTDEQVTYFMKMAFKEFFSQEILSNESFFDQFDVINESITK